METGNLKQVKSTLKTRNKTSIFSFHCSRNFFWFRCIFSTIRFTFLLTHFTAVASSTTAFLSSRTTAINSFWPIGTSTLGLTFATSDGANCLRFAFFVVTIYEEDCSLQTDGALATSWTNGFNSGNHTKFILDIFNIVNIWIQAEVNQRKLSPLVNSLHYLVLVTIQRLINSNFS